MGKIAEVQEVTLSELVPYAKNAKIHGSGQIEKLKASIQEFGFVSPCLIDRDFNIIAGHGRVMAAKELGMEKVPCIFVEGLTDEQRRAYILADNRLGELGEWDMELVISELEDLKDLDFNIELTGFELPTIEPEVEIVEDEIPEPPKEARSKRGDIWQLGVHRLMCGDATMQDDVESLMGGVKADLYITDPPYNIDYEGGTKDALKILNDKMDKDKFRLFCTDAFNSAKTVMKAGAAFYIWLAGTEQYYVQGACIDVGWLVREVLIWKKNALVLGRQDYQWQHEPCLYGWNDGSHAWYSDRKQTTVLEFDKPSRNADHPTMKPVALFDYLIKNSSKQGDIILDNFGGSGTTLMACEQNGRSAYLMELDPKYCDVIIKRWETFTGREAVLLNGEETNTTGTGK